MGISATHYENCSAKNYPAQGLSVVLYVNGQTYMNGQTGRVGKTGHARSIADYVRGRSRTAYNMVATGIAALIAFGSAIACGGGGGGGGGAPPAPRPKPAITAPAEISRLTDESVTLEGTLTGVSDGAVVGLDKDTSVDSNGDGDPANDPDLQVTVQASGFRFEIDAPGKSLVGTIYNGLGENAKESTWSVFHVDAEYGRIYQDILARYNLTADERRALFTEVVNIRGYGPAQMTGSPSWQFNQPHTTTRTAVPVELGTEMMIYFGSDPTTGAEGDYVGLVRYDGLSSEADRQELRNAYVYVLGDFFYHEGGPRTKADFLGMYQLPQAWNPLPGPGQEPSLSQEDASAFVQTAQNAEKLGLAPFVMWLYINGRPVNPNENTPPPVWKGQEK